MRVHVTHVVGTHSVSYTAGVGTPLHTAARDMQLLLKQRINSKPLWLPPAPGKMRCLGPCRKSPLLSFLVEMFLRQPSFPGWPDPGARSRVRPGENRQERQEERTDTQGTFCER